MKDRRGDGLGNEATYMVRKLADGKCWMVQNLELNFDVNYAITSTWSNVASNVVLITNSSYTTANFSKSTGAWIAASTASDAIPRSWNPKLNNSYKTKLYLKNISGSFTEVSDSLYPTEKKGVLYDWYIATAKSGYGISTGAYAQYSICPKGFKLPTGGTTTSIGSSYKLAQLYGIISSGEQVAGSAWTSYMYPLSFSPSGFYAHHQGLRNVGAEFAIWPSGPTRFAGDLYSSIAFSDGYVKFGTSLPNFNHGASIRCISV